jgi:hypothetical protein
VRLSGASDWRLLALLIDGDCPPKLREDAERELRIRGWLPQILLVRS